MTDADGKRLEALAAQVREETGAEVDTAIADAADAAGFKTSLERFAERITPDVVYNAALLTAVSLLHQQLLPEGVHVGSVTVAGTIAPNTAFAPDVIADAFWNLYAEPAGAWTVETVFDGA